MTQFAYYRTQGNIIGEQELILSGNSGTTIAANREAALQFGDAFGFDLIGIFNSRWSDSKWDHEYARLERYGYFTDERFFELFDGNNS